MANELYKIEDLEYKKYGPQVTIGGKPYVVWFWMTDDFSTGTGYTPMPRTASGWAYDDDDTEADAYQMGLSPIKLGSSGYTNGTFVKSKDNTYAVASANPLTLKRNDNEPSFVMEQFIERVQKYIDDHRLDGELTSFEFSKEGVKLPLNPTLTETLLAYMNQGLKPVEPPVPIRKITVRHFMRRFPQEVRVVIRSSDNPYVIDMYEDLKLATFVDLDDPELLKGLEELKKHVDISDEVMELLLADGTEEEEMVEKKGVFF